jgi:cytochrome c556
MFRWYQLMLLVACLVFAIEAYSQVRSAAPDGKTNVQILMRDKLTHMQKLLDGLVTDDFAAVAEQAELLKIVGKAASWQAIDTAEYKMQSRRYTRLTEKLEAAAADGNRDAALLQYLQLNISCVDCHQYIREQQWERNPLPGDLK